MDDNDVDGISRVLKELQEHLEKLNESIDLTEKELRMKLEKKNKIIKSIKNICYEPLEESNILRENQARSLIKLCEFNKNDRWKLIYSGSLHGFGSDKFHSRCDNVSQTLTIVKTTENYIFGGYTEALWNEGLIGKNDDNSFIFSLKNKERKPIKLKFDPKRGDCAIYCNGAYGPSFGNEGWDFYIVSNSNENNASGSSLSYSYIHPNYQHGSPEAKSFLAGSFNFRVKEIEVYQRID